MINRKPEEVILEVTGIAEKIAAPLGFQVVDVRLTQQGRRRSVEVTIFSHTKSVGLSDCEALSRQLGEALEPESNGKPAIIEGSYVLEVQSPGIERELKTPREYMVFAGHPVFVRTKDKVQDVGCEFTGILEALMDGKLHLKNVKPVLAKKAAGHNAKPSKKSVELQKSALPGCSSVTVDMKKVSLVRLYPQDAPKVHLLDEDCNKAE
jgi:ribosome maturation factor RimP